MTHTFSYHINNLRIIDKNDEIMTQSYPGI